VRVERCFGFVDLCGFTAFTERHGDEQTVLMLAQLRTTLRETAARRGVRIVKWLGDGAMLSSTMVDAVVGLVLEVRERLQASDSPQLRVGLDVGPVIMFEGDDYIGRPVNCAARLCDVAAEGQVLATTGVAYGLPPWVVARPVTAAKVAGFREPVQAVELDVAPAGSDESVVDPVCGLRIPAWAAVVAPGGERFCSVACAGIEPAALVR
jgi:class 3 adenylate cyclase